MFLLLEGMDKVGKTSLKEHFRHAKYGEYPYVFMDRGPAGNIFYDKVFNRDSVIRIANFTKDMFDMKNLDYAVVYLTANYDDIVQRHLLVNEKLPDYLQTESSYEAYNKIYESFCKMYDRPLIRINTSLCTKDKAVKSLIKIINERMYK